MVARRCYYAANQKGGFALSTNRALVGHNCISFLPPPSSSFLQFRRLLRMRKLIAPIIACLFGLAFAAGCGESKNDMPELRLTEPQQ